jgi:hypothetical protein
MLSGFTGDATDQLLTTDSYDPVRGAIATATGGALGWLGGRFTRTPTSKVRIKERPALRALTACKVGGNSFVAGTLVLMADGSHKPIEDVQAGDKVLSPPTPQPGAPSRAPSRPGSSAKAPRTSSTSPSSPTAPTGSKTSTLVATNQHPFWVDSEHRWVDAKDLRSGDLLRTAAGTFVQVTAVHARTQTPASTT